MLERPVAVDVPAVNTCLMLIVPCYESRIIIKDLVMTSFKNDRDGNEI